MKEEELPEYFQNVLRQIRHSSGTIYSVIIDSLYNADCVEDFQERASDAMNNLIGDAECIKKMIIVDEMKESTMNKDLTIEDARQIAFETLRYVVTNPDLENFKDLVGRELDTTDDILEMAVGLLFLDENVGK